MACSDAPGILFSLLLFFFSFRCAKVSIFNQFLFLYQQTKKSHSPYKLAPIKSRRMVQQDSLKEFDSKGHNQADGTQTTMLGKMRKISTTNSKYGYCSLRFPSSLISDAGVANLQLWLFLWLHEPLHRKFYKTRK